MLHLEEKMKGLSNLAELGCGFFPSSFSFWALNQAINYLFKFALQTSCEHHEPKGQSSSAQAAVQAVVLFSVLKLLSDLSWSTLEASKHRGKKSRTSLVPYQKGITLMGNHPRQLL